MNVDLVSQFMNARWSIGQFNDALVGQRPAVQRKEGFVLLSKLRLSITPNSPTGMTKDERKALAQEPTSWRGDLSDDCSADWAGLLLRAEWMDEEWWWWCVYDMQDVNEVQIDSSNEYEESCIGSEAARAKAENAARKYLLGLGCAL